MSDIPGVESVKLDLAQATKILNSRIGLVLIFWAIQLSPWGLGPKLDALIRAQDRIAASTEDTRQISINNKDNIIRLLERCEVCRKPHKKQADPDIEDYTARK